MRSRPVFALIGLIAGLIGGIAIAGVEFLLRRRNLREVALPTYLLVYPLVGLGLSWFGYRNRHMCALDAPCDFFSVGPLSPEEAAARGGRIRRFASIGAGIGIAVGLLATALDFAWRGWPFLAGTFVTGLLFYPYIGMIFGFNFSLRPGDPKPSIRNFRFRMQTLMILVTYLGILCGLGIVASRYSAVAIQYQAKALNSQTMVDVFQTVLERARADLKRAERAKELRAGRIPDGLLPTQQAFLKGLEGNATEQYKQYRYGVMADGEDHLAQLAAQNLSDYTPLFEFHKKLAAKYTKAAQKPLGARRARPADAVMTAAALASVEKKDRNRGRHLFPAARADWCKPRPATVS